MSITILNTGQGTGLAASPYSITYPAGINPGDVLFLVTCVDGSTYNPVYPANWNLEDVQTRRGLTILYLSAIADGTESGSFDVTGDFSNRGACWFMWVLENAKKPVNVVFSDVYTLVAAAHVTPVLNAGLADPALYVEALFSDRYGFISSGASSGTVVTLFADNPTTNNDSGLQCAYEIGTFASRGGNTWDLSASDGAVGHTFAIEGTLAAATNPPTGVNATSVGSSARVTWDSQPDADTWTLEVAPDAGGVPGAFTVVETGIISTEYYDVDLNVGDHLWYRLKAIGPAGESAYSIAAEVTIVDSPGGSDTLFLGDQPIRLDQVFRGSIQVEAVHIGDEKIWPSASGEAPGAPVNLQGAFSSPDVNLTWQTPASNEPAYEYKVFRATTQGGPYSLIASGIKGLNYTDLDPGAGTYFYVVRAVGIYGDSINSNEVEIEVVASQLTFTYVDGGCDVDRTGTIFNVPAAAQAGDLILFQLSSGHNVDILAPGGTVSFDDHGSFGGGAEPNFVYGRRVLQSGDLGGTIGWSAPAGDVNTASILVVRPSGPISSYTLVTAFTKNTNDPIADQNITTSDQSKARVTVANYQYRRSMPGATYLTPGTLYAEEIFKVLGYGAMWYNIQNPNDAPATLVMGQADSTSVMLQGGIMFEMN